MEKEFELLLKRKYGDVIVQRLLKQGRLQVQNIKLKNIADQKVVKEHLRYLNQKLGLDFDVSDEGTWAFDFPGWIGELDFSRPNVKKYLVIGLEPHIERFDFQITYGLSEFTPISNNLRFSIDINQNDFIRCENDTSIIWSNLFKLLSDEHTFSSVTKGNDLEAMNGFLNQFYITDLCHFAPQDKANAIFKIKDWTKIRSAVAREYLKDEISLIKPEWIITQGAEGFSKVIEVLKIDNIKNHNLNSGKQKFSVKAAQQGSTKVLSVPHIGSKMIHNTFWRKNLQEVKSLLASGGMFD